MPTWMRNRRWSLVMVVAVVRWRSTRHDAPGQEQRAKDAGGGTAAARDNPLVERWKREAADYRVVLQTSPETVPSLRAEPALDWTNPMRGDDGVCLVWVADGRPQAFACFFRYGGNVSEAHEFHSLATVPLVASLGGRLLWHPRGRGDQAGSHSRPHLGPAASAAERLRQMRGLPGDFKASVDLEKGGTELRLLSQPLFSLRIKVRWRDLCVRHGDRSGSAAADR